MSEKKSADEPVDGPAIAARILNHMKSGAKERVVAQIKAAQPALAAKIEARLFRFDDILELTPQGVQLLDRSVEHDDLVRSLKTATPAVKAKLLENMSQSKRELVEQDFRAMPPTRLSEVEDAQRRILILLDELRVSGKIRTAGKQDVWV